MYACGLESFLVININDEQGLSVNNFQVQSIHLSASELFY